MRALRSEFPVAHLTLVASPPGAQLAPLLPWVDRVITRRLLWQDPYRSLPFDPGRELALVAELAEGRFDAAFLFTGPAQTPYPAAYASYLAGIPVRVGSSLEFGGALLSHAVAPEPGVVHEADNNLRLVEAFGLRVHGRRLELRVPPDAEAEVARMLDRAGMSGGGPLVLVAPGAHAPARRYPLERYRDVVRILARSARVLVVGDPDQRAEAASFGRAGILLGRTTIPQLGALLARADLLIANNSGPMHMAEALGCPVVVLFAGTDDPARWAPRFTPSRLLASEMSCAPCGRFACPTRQECLDVTPARVVRAAQQLLSDTGAERIPCARAPV